jgi:hypothetical protein
MQLDADKTKFLGGDVESTHFVRGKWAAAFIPDERASSLNTFHSVGLDYMLLQKQKASASSSSSSSVPSSSNQDSAPRKALKGIRPSSLVGKKIQGYFMLNVSALLPNFLFWYQSMNFCLNFIATTKKSVLCTGQG